MPARLLTRLITGRRPDRNATLEDPPPGRGNPAASIGVTVMAALAITMSALPAVAADDVPPRVVATSPLDGATGVLRGALVRATFDEALDPASVRPDSLLLSCAGAPVAGTVEYSTERRRQLRFRPSSRLPVDSLCTATVPAGAVRDAAGNALVEATEWTFQTIRLTRLLEVTKRGTGGGRVIGAETLPADTLAIDCGPTCATNALVGRQFVLEAQPDQGSVFRRWFNCPAPDGPRCVIPSVAGDRVVSARFDVPTGRVLMVVANQGFFFQEYFDPRQALEAAGLEIDVASLDGGTAVPHPGSYSGRFTGLAPEVVALEGTKRLAEVRAANYDALVLVGGWGASRYFFAYPGTFSDPAWQPTPTSAEPVNTLIKAFIAQGKRILAVCNGVNVLAWARIGTTDSVSPLNGRHVRAPWASAPNQDDYLGRAYGSSWSLDQACPWEPEPGSACFRMGKYATDNGAIVPGVYESVPDVPDPDDTARRDAIAEDWLFITVQDNFAARTGGQRLAERLTADN